MLGVCGVTKAVDILRISFPPGSKMRPFKQWRDCQPVRIGRSLLREDWDTFLLMSRENKITAYDLFFLITIQCASIYFYLEKQNHIRVPNGIIYVYMTGDILTALLYVKLFLASFYYNAILLTSVCDYVRNRSLHYKSKEEWKLYSETCLGCFAESIFVKEAIWI